MLYIDKDMPNLSLFSKQAFVSSALLGASLGSLFSGALADRLGRKPTIMISDALLIIGPALQWAFMDINILITGRFIAGLGMGFAMMVG